MSLAYDKNNFEFLIKFDEDDEEAARLFNQLPSNARYIVEPRGEGYSGLHNWYAYLYKMAKPESDLFWVIGDDLDIFTKHWDKLILKAHKKYKDKTVIIRAKKLIRLHKQIYPPIKIDSYPVWTRNWLDITGFGTFTYIDVWTAILEHHLFKYHNIDNRVLVKKLKYLRRWHEEIDGVGRQKWNTTYQAALDEMNSREYKLKVAMVGNHLKQKIQKEGKLPIHSLYQVRQQIGRFLGAI